MEAMTYETLIRRALGKHNKLYGKMLSRHGDPAGLADTSVYSLAKNDAGYLIKAKAATIYAMATIQESIERNLGSGSKYYRACDPFMVEAFNAQDVYVLTEIIKSFTQEVEFKAFPPNQ